MFNGKRQQEMPPAANLPTPQRPAPSHRALHPAAQEAAAQWSDMLTERENLREQNKELWTALEVERRLRVGLQRELAATAEKKDFFQRFAVEVNTHLDLIVDAAARAKQRALEMAQKRHELDDEPTQAATAQHEEERTIEQELADTVAQSVAARERPTQNPIPQPDRHGIVSPHVSEPSERRDPSV